MNAAPPPPPHPGGDTITQLDAARRLALGDAAYYPKIVPGVLPIIGASANLELRRWGADFLAEAFACPSLAFDEKQKMSLVVLQTLKDYLDKPGEDAAVIKSAVQTATSVYPLVFKHTIYDPNDANTWHTMAAIKSTILRRMDSSIAGVKICCIKFVTRVVQVQTPGLIADPRRPDQNELSLALVPQDHPLIPPSNLQAEAFGLLDRILNVFQDGSSDALMITATLNSIGILVRTRPAIANRILNAILNFNPFNMVTGQITPRGKVMLKSMERTLRAFLINLNKRNPNHPLAGRIQGYLDRLQQQRMEILEEGSRKRPAPSEPTDGLDPVKRQRLGADIPGTPPLSSAYPPLPEGPISYAQLFSLTQDEGSRGFDVQAIPIDLVNRIIVPIMQSIDQNQLDSAINAVRSRYLSLIRPQVTLPVGVTATTTDVYGNDTGQDEDAEQVMNRLDNSPSFDLLAESPTDVALGPLIIPQPDPLTEQEVVDYGKGTVTRVFGMIGSLGDGMQGKSHTVGFNYLAASNHDRDLWITIISRLATRTLTGLQEGSEDIKREGESSLSRGFSISNTIRDAIYKYVLDDFRRRIDVAITWLNEEWYNDRVQSLSGSDSIPQYERLALRMLEGIVPYLDAKDKVLIRFLSEIPAINNDILERVKRLARDPERVSLAVNAIHYLALFRPPVREICVDALEDLWKNYADAQTAAKKMLARWRPQVVQQSTDTKIKESKSPTPAPNTTAAAA